MMITRENQRKRKISFPAISENIFGRDTSISQNVPTLSIRGVFLAGYKNQDFFVSRYEENAKCAVINIKEQIFLGTDARKTGFVPTDIYREENIFGCRYEENAKSAVNNI